MNERPVGRAWISSVAVLIFLVAWEVAPAIGLVDVRFTSRPTRVLTAGLEILRDGAFLDHARVSLTELALGVALAITTALPVGLILGTSRPLGYLFNPVVMALDAAPRLALLPVLVVWLGIGLESKVAIVFISAVIPMIVNTIAGVRQVDASWIAAARAFCATRRDIFFKVLLPGSLPGTMTGIRLGLGRGVLGVVVGEMYVSQLGIGNQIMQFGASFRVDHLLFYTFLVSGFGFALTSAVRWLEDALRV